jgi:hypothetical protein
MTLMMRIRNTSILPKRFIEPLPNLRGDITPRYFAVAPRTE